MVENAKRAINRIAEDEKTIILNTIALEVEDTPLVVVDSADEQEVSATITMYSIFPLNVEQVKQETADIKPIESSEEPAE